MNLDVATAYNTSVLVRLLRHNNVMYTERETMPVNLDDKRAQIEVLKFCKARIKELEDLQRQARDIVEDALGDNESGTVDGELAVTWKTGKRRTLDQTALKKARPEIVEEFTATTEVRRFVVFE